MDLEKRYDLSILVNDSERMVLDELGKRLDNAAAEGICECQDCVIDMAALALNSLRPLYHASLMGTFYAQAKAEGDYAEAVRKAVDDAIRRVKANPSHA
ncbi:MAG: late competence development ComFB family protein [Spirochaetales bacterium]|nr:late competence development ComFB family protein [Spirochaetales bacterium]MBP7262561.1 late competence development ComFB family protein [Spirochaetia bacterium]